jgi:succinoglycan biosynthesis protein ExoU
MAGIEDHAGTSRMSKVAVIIAAWSAEKTIARAIRSALADAGCAEVIVVDDASQDATAARARECDDGTGRLKVLVQEKNAGPSAARNRAIAESAAPFLAVLDSDDFFLEGRLTGLLRYADTADFVADDMWQVPETDVDGRRTALLGTVTAPETITFEAFVESNVTQKSRQRAELGFIKPLMRRAFLDAHNIRYREDMRLGEDYELYARALALGAKMLLVPAQGYVSVVRPDSLSGRHSETDLERLRDCDAELERLPLSGQGKAALRAHYRSLDCRLQWRLLINAVKARDIPSALKTFLRPWPVPAYLAGQLFEQFRLRVLK